MTSPRPLPVLVRALEARGEARVRQQLGARAAALRQQADEIRRQAELQITALLHAAAELESQAAPPAA